MAIATCNFSHLERKPAEPLDPISCPVCYEEEITPRKLYGHNQAGAVLDPKQHAICKTCLDQIVQERLMNPNLNAVRPFPTCIQCVLPILKIDGINIALKKRVLDQFDRLQTLQNEADFDFIIPGSSIFLGATFGYMLGALGGHLALNESGFKNSGSPIESLIYSLGTTAALAIITTHSYKTMAPLERGIPQLIRQENYHKVGAALGAAALVGRSVAVVISDNAQRLVSTPLLGLQIISEAALAAMSYSKLAYRIMNQINEPLQRFKVMALTAAVAGITLGLGSKLIAQGFQATNSAHSIPGCILGGVSLVLNLTRLAYRFFA